MISFRKLLLFRYIGHIYLQKSAICRICFSWIIWYVFSTNNLIVYICIQENERLMLIYFFFRFLTTIYNVLAHDALACSLEVFKYWSTSIGLLFWSMGWLNNYFTSHFLHKPSMMKYYDMVSFHCRKTTLYGV